MSIYSSALRKTAGLADVHKEEEGWDPNTIDMLEDALDYVPNTSVVNGMRNIRSSFDPTMTPADIYSVDTEMGKLNKILNNPKATTADKLAVASRLVELGKYKDIPVKNILRGGWEDIKSGATKDINGLKALLHKKYTVAKNDAKSRYNKFKSDLPGMYAEGKKQLGDFYDANKGAIWAGGLGAVGGGTIGASLAKNRVLGGLVGAGVGTGVGLGAYRIAKYLGYDI